MAIQTVYTSGSGRIRGVLTDCNGTQILPENVAGIRLNIFKTFMGNCDSVPGYTNKEIPTTAILSEPSEDCEGHEFNFECDPDDGVNPPFPERNTNYIVEVIFISQNNKKSVHQLEVRSK